MTYLPEDIMPIHPLRSWHKTRRLVRDVEAGDDITPILVNDLKLWAGTHRWVANKLLERRANTEKRIRVVELQLLPEVTQIRITRAFETGDLWFAQKQFDWWWHREGGWKTFHLVRSDQSDQTPETPKIIAHKSERQLNFECCICGKRYRTLANMNTCCKAKKE